MPTIINVRDNENKWWKRNAKKKNKKKNENKNKQTNKIKDRKKQEGTEAIVNDCAKWFCCAFKLGFLQLICKYSLICKTNFELALSIILKQRELYDPKRSVDVYETCYPFWYVPQFWF